MSIFNSGVVSEVSWSAGVKAALTRDREASVSWAGYLKSTKHSTGYIKVEHNSAVEEIMNKVTMKRTNFNTIQENKFAHNISVWLSIDQRYFLL